MDARLEPLFTPWKIGNCEIKNRIVLTSMGGTNLLGWMEKNHFDEDGARFIMEESCGAGPAGMPAGLQSYVRAMALQEQENV